MLKKTVRYVFILIGALGLILIGFGVFQNSFNDVDMFGVISLLILFLSALIEGIVFKEHIDDD